MHSDCATITGKAHKLCQDYARANGTSTILADGCSSSPDSDFGARLLVKSVENATGYSDITTAIKKASEWANDLKLERESLDSTLLTLDVREILVDKNFAFQKRIFHTEIYGDGLVAVKLKNGNILSYLINFPSGYPQYLSYKLSPDRQKLLTDRVGVNKKTIHYLEIKADGEIVEESLSEEDERPVIFDMPLFDPNNPDEDIEFAAIMTDGVCSFVRKAENGQLEPIIYTEVLKRMMNIQVPKGEFVQRQMNGFVKEFTKLGWYNVDDFSVGMIYAKD